MRSNENYPLDEPIKKVIVYDFVSFTINEVMVVPFNKANIYIYLNTPINEHVDNIALTMEGEAYNLWGGDDEYLINWINQQLKMLYTF